MTTMIALYDGEGKCIGRCDARCYNAEGADCGCICGGSNHGKGFQAALDTTRRTVGVESMLVGKTYRLVAPPVQLPLSAEEPHERKVREPI